MSSRIESSWAQLVSLILASWNQLDAWLRQIDELKWVA
jgi:hypothetical protein